MPHNSKDSFPVSVIIATYNMPEWLEKVLWGYEVQDHPDFEIIIADDGSGPDTKSVVDRFSGTFSNNLHHLWHEDLGYRRQTILNKAILKSKHPYILFTDGDCVPRQDFISTHVRLAKKNHFLSGGYCKLPMSLSQSISREDILSQRSFDPKWLKINGLTGYSQLRKLRAGKTTGVVLDSITPAGATFNNCNTSCWKEDLIKVNGYDERMQYGGPDRELGERLVNFGVTGLQIRHRAICIHLDHKRGYKTEESLKRNKEIRRQTKKHKTVRTHFGINKESQGA